MDMNSFKNNLKRDLKAEVTPRKVMRAALLPQTKGILNPIKETFAVFVTIIGTLFVQAKLIPADHPAMQRTVTGFNAIWMMIVDASTNLKFKRENIYQIIVFYGIVGMLIFGTLDFLTFIMHFAVGHAHAQVVNNTASLFNEASTDNGPNWINQILPTGNATGTPGLPYAMQGMLVIYNSAMLALGSVLALHQIITMFLESAHHGTFGGNRYSQLWAPLRLVIGIGLLVPITNGYNSAQLIAIDMAEMGSGLASNVWQGFEASLATMANSSATVPTSDVDAVIEKLVVVETCMVASQDLNNTSSGLSGSVTTPTWSNYVTQRVYGANIPGDGLSNASYYTIIFSNQTGDSYCGTLTIPAQQSTADVVPGHGLTKHNYFEQAFVGSNGILSTVWVAATQIYQNSKSGATTNPGGYDPTQNPLVQPPFNSWANFVGQPGAAPDVVSQSMANDTPGARNSCGQTTSYTGGTGMVAQYQTAASNLYNDYQSKVACWGKSLETPDWTKAGYLFLAMAHNAGDLYSLQTPNISVSLPNAEVMPNTNGAPNLDNCHWWQISAPYICGQAGQKTYAAVDAAIKDVQNAAQTSGVQPVAFNPNSIGTGNDYGMLNYYLNAPLANLISGFKETFPTGAPYQFGQSIFNLMFLGNLMLGTTALLYLASALVGGTVFGLMAGMIIAVIGTSVWPIGMGLAVMIPLMPAARFLFGIFAWLLTLFEAMVVMPVVALVMIRNEGEGFFAHGQMGWYLLLQMMLRPVLMIFGLIGGVIVFDTLAKFVNETVFGVWFAIFNTSATGVISEFIAVIGLMYFYLATIYSCANISFKMINLIPDRIMTWIGGPGVHSDDQSDNVMSQAQANSSSMARRVTGAAAGGLLAAQTWAAGKASGGGIGADKTTTPPNSNNGNQIADQSRGDGGSSGGSVSGPSAPGGALPSPSQSSSSPSAQGGSSSASTANQVNASVGGQQNSSSTSPLTGSTSSDPVQRGMENNIPAVSGDVSFANSTSGYGGGFSSGGSTGLGAMPTSAPSGAASAATTTAQLNDSVGAERSKAQTGEAATQTNAAEAIESSNTETAEVVANEVSAAQADEQNVISADEQKVENTAEGQKQEAATTAADTRSQAAGMRDMVAKSASDPMASSAGGGNGSYNPPKPTSLAQAVLQGMGKGMDGMEGADMGGLNLAARATESGATMKQVAQGAGIAMANVARSGLNDLKQGGRDISSIGGRLAQAGNAAFGQATEYQTLGDLGAGAGGDQPQTPTTETTAQVQDNMVAAEAKAEEAVGEEEENEEIALDDTLKADESKMNDQVAKESIKIDDDAKKS